MEKPLSKMPQSTSLRGNPLLQLSLQLHSSSTELAGNILTQHSNSSDSDYSDESYEQRVLNERSALLFVLNDIILCDLSLDFVLHKTTSVKYD
jgi:hypothetical protein